VSLTTGDQDRYRVFPSHYMPRTRTGRTVAGLYLALLLGAEWPLLPLANRIDPTVAGMPFLFVYLGVIYTVKVALLVYAARRQL